MTRAELHTHAENVMRQIGEASLAINWIETCGGDFEMLREALGRAYESVYILSLETKGSDDAAEG